MLKRAGYVGLAAIMLGALVTAAVPQATTSLSAADRAILSAIETAVESMAVIILDGAFPTKILDENGNPVTWAAPNSGQLQAAATVTTAAASCYAADATARERMIRSIATNTADIYFALDDDNSPALTAANAPKVLHPGDEWTTGNDGYTGAIYCLAASGSQSLAKGTVQ